MPVTLRPRKQAAATLTSSFPASKPYSSGLKRKLSPSEVKSEEPTTVDDTIRDVITKLEPTNDINDTDSKPLKTKKATKYVHAPGTTPFPNHAHPTPAECAEVTRLLASVHGPSIRPQKVEVNNSVSGCGEVPSVLDALMRTILSANTSNRNSSTAFQGLIDRFGLVPHDGEKAEEVGHAVEKTKTSGAGSVNWDAVRRAPQKKLYEAIKQGGLADMKSRNMKAILDQVWEESRERIRKQTGREELADDEGEMSLDYLHLMDDQAVTRKLEAYRGVGVKTASCVLLFCLQRESFAVDTHVFRLSRFLNWIPANATRDTAHYHLDTMIPNEYKYALHNLMIRHGRVCPQCKAGPEPSIKEPNSKKPKMELAEDGTPVKVKRTRKEITGNGAMKEVWVEVGTDDEEGCVLEVLVARVRKARKTA